jgi:HD-GYP domain-containing protein (c-di-GMP phosphodiesterase class II)
MNSSLGGIFMFTESEFSLFDFVASISEAIDLISHELNGHHKKVAYISYSIAKEMGLQAKEVNNIVMAASLHDIGAFSNEERKLVELALFNDSESDKHSVIGYELLRKFEPLANAATLIKYHHAHFDKSSYEIPIGSYVISLADKLSILLNEHREILEQIPEVLNRIDQEKSIFHPDTLVAFHRIAKMEYFWIEACSHRVNEVLIKRLQFPQKTIDLKTLRDLAIVISYIVDFRSRFTASHSSGVAAVALEIAAISGFSQRECKLIEIAGFLHDLGKLAISNDILEKNGKLNHEEFNEMRKHSYYTYNVLKKIRGFEQIASCAAYHHERLDGNGYPFHVKGEDFTKLARIMAVADIVTAITEDRPYRSGMECEKAIEILHKMVESGGIDNGIVEIVKENFSRINDVRIKAQQEATHEYNSFYNTVSFHNVVVV